jgi:hypothetical protein
MSRGQSWAECQLCPAGSQCSNHRSRGEWAVTGTSREECERGWYAPPGSARCELCPKGRYSGPGAATCVDCEEGFYCPERLTIDSPHKHCCAGGPSAAALPSCPAARVYHLRDIIIMTGTLD